LLGGIDLRRVLMTTIERGGVVRFAEARAVVLWRIFYGKHGGEIAQ
jgi:hypothetical protein